MPEVETELAKTERHVRQSERHVAIQREIVRLYGECGLPTKEAEQKRKTLEDTLEMHRQHLERLRSLN